MQTTAGTSRPGTNPVLPSQSSVCRANCPARRARSPPYPRNSVPDQPREPGLPRGAVPEDRPGQVQRRDGLRPQHSLGRNQRRHELRGAITSSGRAISSGSPARSWPSGMPTRRTDTLSLPANTSMKIPVRETSRRPNSVGQCGVNPHTDHRRGEGDHQAD